MLVDTSSYTCTLFDMWIRFLENYYHCGVFLRQKFQLGAMDGEFIGTEVEERMRGENIMSKAISSLGLNTHAHTSFLSPFFVFF